MDIHLVDLKDTNPKSIPERDYRLTGVNAKVALEKNLANADWYTTPIPREKMDELLVRKDGPAIRDTLIWFGLLFTSGALAFAFWGSWWALPAFMVYGVIYATTSDSRWHESSHGTAFKTPWMNDALYEIASFMVVRESTVWRWSHARHHSDTIIMGRDPEIVVQRPTNLIGLIMSFTFIQGTWGTFKKMWAHAQGIIFEDEKCYIPESEHHKVIFKARIYLSIYAAVILLAWMSSSILPLMFIGLPTLYGSWLMPIYGYTQHAGLAENVLDHRLNCRTVHMNIVHRFLYWNMGYHVEHHMFPMVPYHQLPKLHELMKDDCPKAYSSLWEAWKEIIPVVFLQAQKPNLYVQRELPPTANPSDYREGPSTLVGEGDVDGDGWLKIKAEVSSLGEISRFDHDGKTYALFRTKDGWKATDGLCTHGRVHLVDGLVVDDQIECPKHNGRFRIDDGSCQRPPVCVPLKTYPVREEEESLYIQIVAEDSKLEKVAPSANSLKVVSNEFVSSFIKELVLEPIEDKVVYQPGQYLNVEIPPFETLDLKSLNVPNTYAESWEKEGELLVDNPSRVSRTYSMASHPSLDTQLKFNVRLATAGVSTEYPPGVGSSYLFSLKPGDTIKAHGVEGDFLITPSQREMLYIGGGAGMAPLKSHIIELLKVQGSQRKISFWYGARSQSDLFYEEEIRSWAKEHENFSFEIALSQADDDATWNGKKGMIHSVVEEDLLKKHPDPSTLEVYLCGPPAMCKAALEVLNTYGIPQSQIKMDEF